MKKLHHFFLMNAFTAAFLLFAAAAQATTCNNAIPITSFPVVGQLLVCGSSNDLNSTSVPGICGTGFNQYKEGKEALYTFTPPTTNTYIIRHTGEFHTAIWVFLGCPTSGGTCVGAVSSSERYRKLTLNLTGGVTYYIWFDRTLTSTADSPCNSISRFSITHPVVNDNCSSAVSFSAIPANGGCSSVLAVTENATGPTTGLVCNYSIPRDDVWYRFTTPPGVTSLHYSVNTLPAYTNKRIEILSGSCSNMTSVGCYHLDNGFINGLNGNTTYYMRIFTGNDLSNIDFGGVFEICLRRPAINDNCTGALAFPAISPDGSCTSVTGGTAGSTDSGLAACQGTADDDVWYSFTAPAGVSALWYSFTPISGATNMTMQVYSGSCSQLVPAGCYGNESGAISNLTAGVTYYLRVYTYASNVASEYSLCLRAPVANDNCSGAFSFPAIPGDGACATATINTTEATGPEGWVCDGYPNDDVWMSFVTPVGVAALSYEITMVSGNPNIVFQLYPNSCGTAPIGCFSGPSGIITGLAGNSVYYLRLYTRIPTARAVFNMCLRAIVPPPNDQCAGAIALPPIPIDGTCLMTSVSTYGATGTQSATCAGSEDDDVWYSFTPPPGYTSVHYSMSNQIGSSDRVIQVMRGSCSGALTSVGCYDPEVGTITGLNSNTTYYLRIFSYESSMFSAFNLCLRVTPPAINDECTSAMIFPAIPTNGSCATISSTTVAATGVSGTPCVFGTSKDVWFVFEVPAGGTALAYELTPFISNASHGMNLYRGSCSELVPTGQCYSESAGRLELLEEGATYYLRVFTSGTTSPFSLCLRTAPPRPIQDECEGAIAFPPIAPEGGCSTVRVSTFDASGIPDVTCSGWEDDDVWYTFTTPADATKLIYEITPVQGSTLLWLQVFSGVCGSLVPMGCYGFNSVERRRVFTGLEGNTTYYLRAYTGQEGISAVFDVCLINPVENDDCIQATNFPDFPTDGSCAEVTVATHYASGQYFSSGPCQGTKDDDVWFQFTTPPGISHLKYKVEHEYFLLEYVFSILVGTCDNLQLVGCYSSLTGTITGLSGNTTYYLRAYTLRSHEYATFKICLTPPPPNDDCFGAIAFPPIPADGSCATIQTTTIGAGGTADPTCPGNETNDVWLSFTPPAGASNVYYELGSQMQVQLLKGNCDTLIHLACFNTLNGVFQNLNDSETYYIRLYGSNSNVDVCLRTLTANDECTGAIALPTIPADGSCARITVSAAELASLSPDAGSCGGYGKDVWFSFVAPNNDVGGLQVIREHISGSMFSDIEFYSGQCGNLTGIRCIINSEGWVFSGLTAGETYYMRVTSQQNSNFHLCLKTPAINDLCANAIAFPPIPADGSCATFSGGTFGATGTLDPTCPGSEDDDVWLTFTTPTGVNTLFYELLPPYDYQIQFQIYAGNCASPIPFGCFSETRGEINGLTGGTVYYVRVYSFNNVYSRFNLCLKTRPSNDLCSGALPFPEIPEDGNCASLRVTAFGGTATPGMVCGGSRDVWYTFTTPPGATRLRYINSNSHAVNFQILSGDCGTSQSLGCYTGSSGIITNLSGSTTYYLRIYSFTKLESANLCLGLPASNDECIHAIDFPAWQAGIDSISVMADNRGATSSPAPSCPQSNFGDVWLRFTVPPNVSRLVCWIGNSQVHLISGIQILSGDCTNLSSAGCYAAATRIILTNLQGGNTYYIRVLGSTLITTGGGLFNISLYLPPSNDDCIDASVLTFPTNGSCTNVSVNTWAARETTTPGCPFTSNRDDLWYVFTCPPGMTTLNYSITNVSGGTTPVLQLFGGSCGNLNALGCYANLNGAFNGLTENNTYYLRAYREASFTGLRYDICFSRPWTPPPPNDNCQDAIALPEMALNGACMTISGTIRGATFENPPACSALNEGDVWYTFRTPPDATHILFNRPDVGSFSGFMFEILSGSCGNFTSLGCYGNYSEGIITGLQGNTTYYLRVLKSSTGSVSDFALCLQVPVHNDICSTAVLIDGCTESINGTLALSTPVGAAANCTHNSSSISGVWYRWVGDGLPVVVSTCPSGSSLAYIQVYAGNCDSLVCVIGSQTGCGFYGAVAGWHSRAGENYYVYVYGGNAAFTLTVGRGSQCSAPASASLMNLTDSTATIAWPAVAGAAYYKYAVSRGTVCEDASPVFTTSDNAISLSGLLPLTEYTFCLRAHCSCTSTGSATIRFTTPARPLPNDFCATALTVSCGSTISGNTEGAFADTGLSICDGTNLIPGKGIWYQLEGDGSLMTFDLCASSFDTKVHVYAGGCGSLQCVASNDDACGPQSQVTFQSISGVIYYILVSGADDTSGDFTMEINCVCQLPLESPWTTASIGGAQGNAFENLCNGSIDLHYEGNAPTNQADRQMFVFQNVCDTFSLITRVNFIHPGAFAGIAIRESLEPGARMVALKSKGTKYIYLDTRTAADGPRSTQQAITLNHTWLRLTRAGNVFTAHSSADGQVWQQHFVVNLSMPDCLQAGLFVENAQLGASSTGVFAGTSIVQSAGGTSLPDGDIPIGDFPMEFTVFPNPAQTELRVVMGSDFSGRAISMSIVNQLGQTMTTRKIEAVENLMETFDVQAFPPGVYMICLRAEGSPIVVKKCVVSGSRY